jgi:thiamine kinase-like enzyme
MLGAEITRAARVWGGYAPSATFRLTLANGQRAFFKGCGPDDTDFIREVLQTETRVYTELSRYISPWAPDLLGAFSADGWQALLLEDVGPKTAPPWTSTLTQRVMRAYAEFHQASIGAVLPAWLPRFTSDVANFTWEDIAHQTDNLHAVAALAGTGDDEALRWLRDAEPLFARLLAEAPTIPAPTALLHFDTRSDNLRLSEGRLRLFDWPAAMVGPVEIDVTAFAQSIAVEGGPPPEQCLAWYDGTLRQDVLDIALIWILGFFATRAILPDIPGLPRLRRFQRQQLAVMLQWCARRFSLANPDWSAALRA